MLRGLFRSIENEVGSPFTSNPDDAPKIVRYATIISDSVNYIKNKDFHRIVKKIIHDPRGWSEVPEYNTKFIKILPESLVKGDLRIILGSEVYVDIGCPGTGSKHLSCCNLNDNTIYINAINWHGGNGVLKNSKLCLDDYRNYVINHEVGHFLRLDHASCEDAMEIEGEITTVPIMSQLSSPGRVGSCMPNCFPRKKYPH